MHCFDVRCINTWEVFLQRQEGKNKNGPVCNLWSQLVGKEIGPHKSEQKPHPWRSRPHQRLVFWAPSGQSCFSPPIWQDRTAFSSNHNDLTSDLFWWSIAMLISICAETNKTHEARCVVVTSWQDSKQTVPWQEFLQNCLRGGSRFPLGWTPETKYLSCWTSHTQSMTYLLSKQSRRTW